MKKKMVTVLLTAAMVTAMAAGCGSSSDSGSDKKESYTIGIEQFAEHGSLDNCREGFLKGLEAEGIKEGDNLTVKYKNAAADMGTAKQISDSLVSDKVDLVCAIATPSAQSAYNAAMKADIPVIYTAVTDPVAAELADKDGKPVGEVVTKAIENGLLVISAGTNVLRMVPPLVITEADVDEMIEKLEKALSETKLQEYKLTEENGQISIYAKGVPAHASTPTLGVNAAAVTFECLEKAGFEDDFVKFYNEHIGTSCDGAGVGLKFEDEYGALTLCNGIVKTEDGIISCTIDIRVPVTLKAADVRTMCEARLEDENGRIEIGEIGDPLFFPRESPLVNALYKAYVDVTGDTEHEPMVIGGGTYAKSLKNIIAFGPEKMGMDYHIHSADEFILVSEMEKAVLIYMEAIKNLLAI